MTDKIMVGKLAGCRVCDAIPDYYEYLIWAEKAGLLKFQGIVTETIQEHAGFKDQQQHYDQEIKPWIAPELDVAPVVFDDDVPF